MSQDKYFDLHISGIGYINRIRDVPVRRAEPFLAADIVAIHGHADEVQHTRFDCRISGEEARRVVASIREYVEADRKVLIGFKLGDLYPDLFVYRSGEKAGQTGISLKARLLRIGWVRVDGETIYTAPAVAQNAESANVA